MGALRANGEMVVHETIDAETILIHMGTGTYYSVEGAESDIWNLAVAGYLEDAIASQIAERYAIDPELASRSVVALLRELRDEELLLPVAEAAEDPVALPPPPSAFSEPVLHKYTDMQDFILVDPLHDVDTAAGWPHAAAD
jgi:hypothetical protein